MKTKLPCIQALCLIVCLAPWTLRSQSHTQSIPLHAGWNAIWVEVEPTNNAIGAVFTNLPVEAVWAYFEKGSTADFIQNVNELPWNNPSWRRWFPPESPKAVINNLYTINVNRAYLVKATNVTTLNLTGRPSVRPKKWTPDSFNLQGFPIDPERPPTFDYFFAPASAHAGQPIHRLNTNGLWEIVAGYTFDVDGYPVLIPGTNTMKSGEAYWVYSYGASDYSAPVSVKLQTGDGLDYGSVLNEQTIALQNLSSNDVVVEVSDYSSGALNEGEMPLAYYDLAAPAGSNWVTFESPRGEFLAVGDSLDRRLAIRRGALTAEKYEALLYIADGAGTRYFCPLTAEQLAGTGGGMFRLNGPAPGESDHTGLWVGNAVINAVSDASGTPTPTRGTNGNGSEFNLRLVLHVDTNGVTRLLKQVIQLWRDGSYITNLSNGLYEVDTNNPGRFVLVTDDSRIPDFKGATLRDGEPVGRRISCAGIDFPDESGQPPCARLMQGTFGLNGALTNQFTVASDFPTNPFKHRRHPDHDNLDADFTTPKKEAPDITRTIELQFLPDKPADLSVPDYGYNVIAGTYHEVLHGLHQRDLVVAGTFRLNRVSVIGELNPPSNP